MNAHIGHCFPSYVKMMAHVEMKYMRGSVDEGQLDWWKQSMSVWGGDQAIGVSRN